MSMSDRSIQVNDIFDEWELWACLLLSLFLQIFLSFGGTFRRLVSHKWIVILLWLAYLLAEIIAFFGLGLIVSQQSFIFMSSKYTWDFFDFKVSFSSSKDRLHIFWAPFLLVHLGGPDTITAFAPEDNELWPRHLFYLASQCVAVAYAFYQSQHFQNRLLVIPTLLMCFCGIIKCIERTAALYYGSANSFRNSMLLKSDRAASIKKKESKLLIKNNGNALSHLQVLQYAFVYFTAFKGLIVDLNLSIQERNQSREFFLATSCEDAFRLIEVELHYLYDVLFTKIPVLHHKLGYFCRILSFAAVVASFTLFHLEHHAFGWKVAGFENGRLVTYNRADHKNEYDVLITYILLVGAVVLEVIAFYMLLFCDWTVITLRPISDAKHNGNSWKDKCLDCILFVNNVRSELLHFVLRVLGDRDHHAKSKFTDSRWANSLSTFNIIYYCLHRCSKGRENFYSYFGLLSFLNGVWYVKPQPLTNHTTRFIFGELKLKSEMAGSLDVSKEICSSKGERVLHEMKEDCSTLLPFVANLNYDDILLLWHIATELCYNDSKDLLSNKEQRDTAKKLSEYMLYLMVVKPDMMSGVSSIGEIKFRDTCTEVSKFLDAKLPELKKKRFCNFFRRKSKLEEKEALQRKACETILSVNREAEPVAVQMDSETILSVNREAEPVAVQMVNETILSVNREAEPVAVQMDSETILSVNREAEPGAVQMDRGIFSNASALAEELRVLPSEKKWLIISKLWVELLSYAATHIRSSAHAEQLSKGGELITVVWLLMAHFGLGEQYEINPGKHA